uniref:5_nucleotid_C domain-containing protein n=1 Tax=Macrostomum lignano TaxID=282301 RepID=A0A1I8F8P1_9PLAT
RTVQVYTGPHAYQYRLRKGYKYTALTHAHWSSAYTIEQGKSGWGAAAHSALQRRVNIEPAGHIGGAARFVTRRCALSPSSNLWCSSPATCSARRPSSTATRGQHLVQCAQSLNIDAACFGNHDFDFGVDNGASAARRPDFPGCCPNIIDRERLAGAGRSLETVCIDHRASGLRIGIVGLVELEWVDTLSTVDPEDIRFFDFCTRRRAAGRQAEAVTITITASSLLNNRAIVKSGTDFRQFQRGQPSLSISLRHSKSRYRLWTLTARNNSEDPEVAKAVERVTWETWRREHAARAGPGGLDRPGVPVRAHPLPRRPTLGNFIVSDIVLTALQARLRAESTLRLVQGRPVLVPGWLTSASTAEPCLATTGRTGVSMWPALDEADPQACGGYPACASRFDGTRPPGSRSTHPASKSRDKPMVADTQYRMATKYYLYCGKDGYDIAARLPAAGRRRGRGPVWSVAVQNYFTASGAAARLAAAEEPAPLPPAANEPSTVLRGGQPAGRRSRKLPRPPPTKRFPG